MALPAESKGKQKASDSEDDHDDDVSPSGSNSYSSDSESDSGSGASSDDDVSKKLDLLLGKGKKTSALREEQALCDDPESDIIVVEKNISPLPSLDPSISSNAYLQLNGTQIKIRDPDVERAEQAASKSSVPAQPIAPLELSKDGKPLTKKQRKELKKKTAGPDWFDLPAPSEAELPHLYREVEALRLRNQLDPKRFYRKDEGEGKGIKGLPQYFAVGTILPTETPFGTPSVDNIPKSHRKRTIVDELVDDAEAKSYAKKRFKELQAVREAKGKKTLVAKKLLRRPKW